MHALLRRFILLGRWHVDCQLTGSSPSYLFFFLSLQCPRGFDDDASVSLQCPPGFIGDSGVPLLCPPVFQRRGVCIVHPLPWMAALINRHQRKVTKVVTFRRPILTVSLAEETPSMIPSFPAVSPPTSIWSRLTRLFNRMVVTKHHKE